MFPGPCNCHSTSATSPRPVSSTTKSPLLGGPSSVLTDPWLRPWLSLKLISTDQALQAPGESLCPDNRRARLAS